MRDLQLRFIWFGPGMIIEGRKEERRRSAPRHARFAMIRGFVDDDATMNG